MEAGSIPALLSWNYEYYFVVDGLWMADRENERFVFNEFGTRNSVFEI